MELAALKERFLGKQDIWDIDYNEPNYDHELTMLCNGIHRGSIRISMDLFQTKDEWERFREQVLRTPMP